MTDTPQESPAPIPPPASGGGSFDLNHPTIISLLYLSGMVFGFTGLIGVILAFVWKGEPHEAWEDSHYQYLINTFWIGLAGSVIGIILMLVLIGVFVLIATAVLVVVRSIFSLLRAQKKEPMPNPATWLA